ncbi:MAG: type II toxin-antitoxin system Phd/YefM family antitoxin [Planctomycetota bacterium]
MTKSHENQSVPSFFPAREEPPESVNIHQAKTHFSKLLRKVQRGQEIVIAKAGKPLARLVPMEGAGGPRIEGQDRGKVWIADDFDAPLPDDEAALFEEP